MRNPSSALGEVVMPEVPLDGKFPAGSGRADCLVQKKQPEADRLKLIDEIQVGFDFHLAILDRVCDIFGKYVLFQFLHQGAGSIERIPPRLKQKAREFVAVLVQSASLNVIDGISF